MVYMTSDKAIKLFHHKGNLEHHRDKQRVAVFEFIAWRVKESLHYPEGIKYRAWLSEDGITLFGLDNHKPKGHHLHLRNLEIQYFFRDLDSLKLDVVIMVRKEGFIIDE
jgi:hypothetical protein